MVPFFDGFCPKSMQGTSETKNDGFFHVSKLAFKMKM
jgi:hypothetical protein